MIPLYLTLECQVGVPGCESTHCGCWCHAPDASVLRHMMPGMKIGLATRGVNGYMCAQGEARIYESWMIQDWFKEVLGYGYRPLGIPNVHAEAVMLPGQGAQPEPFVWTLTLPISEIEDRQNAGTLEIAPGSDVVWRAEGLVLRPQPAKDRQDHE